MAKRRFPVPSRSVDPAAFANPFAPPDAPTADALEAEAEPPERSDPLAPGQGEPRAAKPVNLSWTEIDKLAQEFASEIELQQSAQEQIRYDWQRWLKTYRGRPLFDNKTYPLAHSSNVTVRLAGTTRASSARSRTGWSWSSTSATPWPASPTSAT